jgi:hypothetical protein
MLVYETGDAEPTPASSPVPTPAKFEATGLRYRFRAIDPTTPDRISPVKDWTAKLRLKQQLHNRGDHYEVELLALPKAGGVTIRYTTDGSAPTGATAATYENAFRVPANSRIVCAIATAPAAGIQSEIVRIPIPKKGAEDPILDPNNPARWNHRLKLDEAGLVWDLIQRLGAAGNVTAYDITLTAESADGQQHVELSAALDEGYSADSLKSFADRLQELVGTGSLRMSVGSLGFQTGQNLLDWLKATNQPFDISKVRQ